MDIDDPFGSYGLGAVELNHKTAFDSFFASCRAPLSDYTFANTFIWRNSIHLRWRLIADCLCVFANGDGGLTMLFPPLGPGDAAAAMRQCLQICGDYNARAKLPDWTRIEYVSPEAMNRLGGGFTVESMSGDYVYATERMIDLAGGDLASKRQARNRFARRYAARIEDFEPRHVEACLELLGIWRQQSEPTAQAQGSSVCIKRAKELAATGEALMNHRELGLTGMVLYAGDELAGFTFGEPLGDGQTVSIVIEKTDRRFAGAANYIFSEFCRRCWPHTRWCNVGDDWDVPSLAWTKQSYRPAMRIPKFILRPAPAILVSVPPPATDSPAADPLAADPHAGACPTCTRDRAVSGDLDALLALEQRCFAKPVAMSRRQFRYLLASPHATTHVLRRDGRIVGSAIVLRRRTARGLAGRLYSLSVDSRFRGQGLGRTLLGECLGTLKAEGVRTVCLEVDASNQVAIGLYESAGFRRDSLLRDYYAPGRHGWKMRLEALR